MAYILPLGLGLVAGAFLLIVLGEVFYLFYWKKRRPLANPRVNNITLVSPVGSEGIESVGTRLDRGGDVVIDVACAEYQISALHQDLMEKLFPSMGGSTDASTPALMAPPRMLFTITEETREELEGLDLDGKTRSRRSSRSKSMSDISLSPLTPLSPLSTPFVTPLSSPDPFLTPYGTPTYSPLVNLTRSLSANPVFLKTSCRIMYDYGNLPPPAPPSPTRPSFPFLARPPSPNKSPPQSLPDAVPSSPQLETYEWQAADEKLSPKNSSNGTLYSPPLRPFVFASSPIHSKQVDSFVKPGPPASLRNCKFVYENGVYENGSFSPLESTAELQASQHSDELEDWPSSSPPLASATDYPRVPVFSQATPPSDTVVSDSTPDSSDSCSTSSSSTSSSCKPSSQRSSLALFSSVARPFRPHVLPDERAPKPVRVTAPVLPPIRNAILSSSGWAEKHVSSPFIVQPTSVAR